MNVERLQKLAASVRTGGKGSVRRKKKAVHKTGTDDKRVQATLKRLGLNPIPGIEEVLLLNADGTALQFNNPKVQAATSSNTFVVSGPAQQKRVQDVMGSLAGLMGGMGGMGGMPGMGGMGGMPGMGGAGGIDLAAMAQMMGGAAGGGGGGAFVGGGPGRTQVEEVSDDDEDGVPDLVESFEGAAAQGQ